jgi:hypothetical protein
LPVDIGLVTELAFERPEWSTDSRRLTFLPILERRFGRIQFDLNPTFEKSLHGPDSGRGWTSGLAARIALQGKSRFTPSLEYYADWGPVPAFEPLILQGHQLIPGGDIRLRKNIIWSVGLGVGLTPATDRVVYKSRLEIKFGGGSHH